MTDSDKPLRHGDNFRYASSKRKIQIVKWFKEECKRTHISLKSVNMYANRNEFDKANDSFQKVVNQLRVKSETLGKSVIEKNLNRNGRSFTRLWLYNAVVAEPRGKKF